MINSSRANPKALAKKIKTITFGKVHFPSFRTMGKVTFLKVIIFIVLHFRIAEKVFPTCVRILLQNPFAGYYSGNYSAREIYFAKLFPIS